MKTRIITGLVLAAIFIPLLMISELFILFQILMMALVIGATGEMIKLYENKEKFPKIAKITIYVSTLVIYLSLLADWTQIMNWTEVPIGVEGLRLLDIRMNFSGTLMLITLVMFSMIVFSERFDGGSVGRGLTIVLLVGLSFGALTILRFNGIRFLIFLFMTTILTDVFAYFVGMKIGKHKMAPKISPKKSWEGAIGGTLVATIVVSLFAYFYAPIHKLLYNEHWDYSLLFPILPDHLSGILTFGIIFIIVLLTSVVGQIGDLIASRLKRSYGIKDFGKIFPGHGGIMDRLDSAMISAIFLLSAIVFLVQIFG